MKKLSIGLICVIMLGYLLKVNEVSSLKEERDVLIAQNEQYELQIQELSDQEFSRREMFQVAAEVYRVDFELIYAMAKWETGYFKSRLFRENNNPGGIKSDKTSSGWAYYDTEFEGIMEMARLIRNGYYDYGLDTPEEIGAKYCPDDPTWAKNVRNLMGQE